LGQYFRVGRNDHKELLELLARRDAQCFGLVQEATSAQRQKELRERALELRLDVILDPQTQAAATIGGYSAQMAKLPWGLDRPALIDDFRDMAGRRRIAALADFAIDNGYTQVLAPSHLIEASDDPWFDVDRELINQLRTQLDRKGGNRIQILYSLAAPYSVMRDEHERSVLLHGLQELPIEAVWLRIEGLGSDATANGIRNYLRAATAFGTLRKPVVADGIGGIAGLSVLAFGAAGGIAHGITFGERVDHSSWRKKREDQPFGRARRVYFPDLDLLLEPEEADQLVQSSTRAKALLGCRDTHCCPRGTRDMLENRARHFLVQRMKQVAELSKHHLPIRAARFVENVVRPASDALVQATGWHLKDELLVRKLIKQRRRLDSIRTALAADINGSEQRVVTLPKMRSVREHRPGL
jgi:hypothetical protein